MVEMKNVLAIVITAAILFFLIFGFPGLDFQKYLGFGKDVIRLPGSGPLPMTAELSLDNINLNLDIRESESIEGEFSNLGNVTVNARQLSFRDEEVELVGESFIGQFVTGNGTSEKLIGTSNNLDINGIIFNGNNNFEIKGEHDLLKITGVSQSLEFPKATGTVEVKNNKTTQTLEIVDGSFTAKDFKGTITLEEGKLKLDGTVRSASTAEIVVTSK